MSRIEERYSHIFEKLGTNNVEEIRKIIENEVIPFDIQKQSRENEIRDKLQ